MADVYEFNKPTDGQLSALWRMVRTVDDPDIPVNQKLDMVVRVEDIVLSCLTDQSLVDEVRNKLMMGKISLFDDLAKACISAYAGAAAPAAGPVKAVRRGRPRKAV